MSQKTQKNSMEFPLTTHDESSHKRREMKRQRKKLLKEEITVY